MHDHVAQGVFVHLLVRKSGKVGPAAAPFIYCGEVDFVDWEGEKPITVRWKLREAVPPGLDEMFGIDRVNEANDQS